MKRLYLLLAPLLLGCASLPPSPVRVEGVLFLRPGGPVVEGAWVYFSGEKGAWAVRTAGDGRFTLYLPPGVYTAWTEGEGLAASRVEGVRIQGSSTFLPIAAFPPFRPAWPKEAPQVWLMGPEVSGGLVRYRAGMASSLPGAALLVGLGLTPSPLTFGVQTAFYGDETEDTGWRALAFQGLGGEVELRVVAYDYNNNRTEVRRPLSLPFPGDSPGGVRHLKAVAYTLAREVEVLSSTPRYALWVRLTWEGGGGSGFRVYRREDAGWVALAQLPSGVTVFQDGAGLVPGKRVCYRVEEVDGPREEACTTPLPPFSVEILSPAHGEETGPDPTFRWGLQGSPGGSLSFLPMVWDLLSGTGQTLPPTSGFEARLGAPLQRGREYGFELYQAYAVDNPQDPTAYSVAADRQGTLAGYVVPGPFVGFKVAP